jgi:hypothetical protein
MQAKRCEGQCGAQSDPVLEVKKVIPGYNGRPLLKENIS